MSAIGGAATFATNMGLAAANDNESQNVSTSRQTQRTTLNPMSGDERALSRATTDLGMEQTQALRNLMGGSFALSPAEMAQLDAMYAPQEANLRRFGQLMGQDLASTRGLNTSDTPVSEAVLREMLPAMGNLLSNKMQTGLGLGMQMKGLNLNAAMGMPGASAFNLNKLFNERLATGSTTVRGTGTQAFRPGFLDRMATTAGAQQGITQAGQNLMGKSGFGW